jgi:hypothetical protein
MHTPGAELDVWLEAQCVAMQLPILQTISLQRQPAAAAVRLRPETSEGK